MNIAKFSFKDHSTGIDIFSTSDHAALLEILKYSNERHFNEGATIILKNDDPDEYNSKYEVIEIESLILGAKLFNRQRETFGRKFHYNLQIIIRVKKMTE